MYTPQEAVARIYNADRDKENLSGTNNKNMQRIFIGKYKQAMIDQRLVPIKSSALNDLVKKHGKYEQSYTPVY